MKKNGIACAFALIGFGLSLSFAETETGFNWLTVAACVCAAAFIGYVVAGFLEARSTVMRQNFVSLGDLRGRSLDEIKNVVGEPQSHTKIHFSDRDNAPGYRYTWSERSYCIVLLFDDALSCIGVESETKL